MCGLVIGDLEQCIPLHKRGVPTLRGGVDYDVEVHRSRLSEMIDTLQIGFFIGWGLDYGQNFYDGEL